MVRIQISNSVGIGCPVSIINIHDFVKVINYRIYLIFL